MTGRRRPDLEGAEEGGVEVEGQQGIDNLDGVLFEDEAGVKVGGVHADLFTLQRQLALLGRQLEQLVVPGIHAAALNVTDLALQHIQRACQRRWQGSLCRLRPGPDRERS